MGRRGRRAGMARCDRRLVGMPDRQRRAQRDHQQAQQPGQAPPRDPAIARAGGQPPLPRQRRQPRLARTDGRWRCRFAHRVGQGQACLRQRRIVLHRLDHEVKWADADGLAADQAHAGLRPLVDEHRAGRVQNQAAILGAPNLGVVQAHPRVGQIDLAGCRSAQAERLAGDRTGDPPCAVVGTRIARLRAGLFDQLAADHGALTSR